MATVPSFISEFETVWNTTTSPKTTGNITTQVGDVLVVAASCEFGNTDPAFNTPTNTGTAETWSLQQAIENTDGTSTAVAIWTTVCAVAQTMTVSLTRNAAAQEFGFNVLQFRGSDGVGASNKATAKDAAATVNVTTTQANSAIVGIVSDWEATSATVTWPAGLGTWTKQTTFDDAAHSVHVAWLSDSGAIGSKTVDPVLANSLPDYSLIVVEVKGAASTWTSNQFPRGICAPPLPQHTQTIMVPSGSGPGRGI